MIISRMSVVAAAVLLCAGGWAQGLEEAQQQITSAWESHGSMRCNVNLEAGPAVGENRMAMTGSGTAQAMRSDGLDRYKSTVKMNFAPPMEVAMQVETVFDGTSLHISNDTLGRRLSKEATPGLFRGAVPPGGARLLEALAEEMKLERLPDTTIGETEAFVLEGKARRGDQGPGPVARVKAFVARDTGALLRLELYETDQVITVRLNHTDFEWDVELDPAMFQPAQSDATTVAPDTEAAPAGASTPGGATSGGTAP